MGNVWFYVKKEAFALSPRIPRASTLHYGVQMLFGVDFILCHDILALPKFPG